MNEPYDFVVIGGGSAGYAGAATAARLGLRTVVVEGGQELGGLCILRGCMPSKALLESAHRARIIRHAAEFGLRAEYLGADAMAIRTRKRRVIAEFADYRRQQLEAGKFELLRGTARFLDPHRLELTLRDGGVRQIEGRAFLIATGSRLNRVALPGLDAVGCWNSDQVLDAEHLPKSVIILGGGAVALEFASYYAGLGTEVSVIQRSAHLLKDLDADVADALKAAMEAQGIRVYCKTALEEVTRENGLKRVSFVHDGVRRFVDAEEIVYGLGRRPASEGLDLEQVGVRLKQFAVGIEDTQQTSVPHLFAAGDVCGPHEVVHLAIQQAEVAARNAARLLNGETGQWERMDYRLKLFAVFTEPEVAAVGLSEREAMAQGLDYLTASYPFSDHGKSIVGGATEGFVKLLCARDTRRILGASVIGPAASDLIHEVVVAMHFNATAGDLARVPHYHPTLSEIWTYPAEELAAES